MNTGGTLENKKLRSFLDEVKISSINLWVVPSAVIIRSEI